jgi:non-ribosomal peptide synthetase component F
MLNDFDHQQFTFGSLLKKLNIARDPSRIPLVPIAFNIDMGLDDGVSFVNLKHRLTYNPRVFENFEIFLNATGSEQSLILECSYNTQLFSSDSIHKMMNGFIELLSFVVEGPGRAVKEILVPSLRRERNQIKSFSFPNKTIAELFSEQVSRTPDKPALVFENFSLTYRELDEKANQLAHFLKRKGVRAETLVPICVERSANIIIGILGILKAGGAYVPIDPEYPQERINLMIDDCRSQIIICSLPCKNKIRADKNRMLIILEKVWEEINRESKSSPKLETNPDSLAYIMFTSGSTGRPKGVMIENKNVVSLVSGVDYVQLNQHDALLSTGSPSFDATTYEYWECSLMEDY